MCSHYVLLTFVLNTIDLYYFTNTGAFGCGTPKDSQDVLGVPSRPSNFEGQWG
jgi:hypothetical protein